MKPGSRSDTLCWCPALGFRVTASLPSGSTVLTGRQMREKTAEVLSTRGCEVWPQGAARDKRGDIQGMERAVPAEGTGVLHTMSRGGGQQGEKTSQTDTCVRWLAVSSRKFVKLPGH